MKKDMKKITDQIDAGLLAKNPADISQDSFITRNLNKLSLLIYRKFLKKRQLPGAENVRACLSALYDTRNGIGGVRPFVLDDLTAADHHPVLLTGLPDSSVEKVVEPPADAEHP